MGEEQKNVPKLRFKGYEDAWEQRKLGEVFDQTVEYVNPKLENIELWSVTVESGLTPKTERYNREALVKKEDKFKLVHPGDVVYNPMNMTIGAVGMNQQSNSIAVSGYYVTMRLRENFNGFYFFEWLSSDRAMNLFRNHATGSLIEKQRVQFPTLSNIDAYVPEFLEQKNIGQFFQRLDKLITLHQRKYDALKTMKKTLLSKMFPKDGEDVPEIRFKGFTDAWEQRKLGEVFDQTVEYVNPKLENIELWSVTVESGLTPKTERYNREALVKKEDKFKLVHPGDVVYNPMNMTIGAVGMNQQSNSIAVSGYYVTMRLRENFNGFYFFEWLSSDRAMNLFRNHATGSLIEKQRVQFPTLSNIDAYVPEFLEQKNIGQFFQRLDKLITLHQRKLDELKNMKKTLLQQMFV